MTFLRNNLSFYLNTQIWVPLFTDIRADCFVISLPIKCSHFCLSKEELKNKNVSTFQFFKMWPCVSSDS